MAITGISRIDQLLGGQTESIGPNASDQEAVGVLQDLLMGHDMKGLPGLLGKGRGLFGNNTAGAVREFQKAQKLPETGVVDSATLRKMVDVPSVKPIACLGYLALSLDILFKGMIRVMSLTSQFEGAGLFTAINRNTDRAGLSFGLIQWAQKPGRLNEILRAFQAAQPALFVQIFGGGDAALAQGLINHTAKPRGGTNEQGKTIDSRYDLTSEPWVSRFIQAGRNRELQRVQVNMALAAFKKSFDRVRSFAPQIRTERGIAFMLDVANQHGDGGAQSIFTKVNKPGLSEAALLAAIQQESVARVRSQFGEGAEVQSTQNRRETFRTTSLFMDQPFDA
jgi:peptidoglycan hydrolase-like protein with peptidoglycan-binding domain